MVGVESVSDSSSVDDFDAQVDVLFRPGDGSGGENAVPGARGADPGAEETDPRKPADDSGAGKMPVLPEKSLRFES